jgi:hypothetical protein
VFVVLLTLINGIFGGGDPGILGEEISNGMRGGGVPGMSEEEIFNVFNGCCGTNREDFGIGVTGTFGSGDGSGD